MKDHELFSGFSLDNEYTIERVTQGIGVPLRVLAEIDPCGLDAHGSLRSCLRSSRRDLVELISAVDWRSAFQGLSYPVI